jgi:hypothetical protein
MRKSVCSSILLTWPSATSFITETPKASRIGFFFTATRWHGEPVNQEPHKCAGLHWTDLARPPREHRALYRRGADRHDPWSGLLPRRLATPAA